MNGVIEAFVLLLGIIDPLVCLTAFLSLTKNVDEKEKRKIAFKAVLVAATVFFVFAICGSNILAILGVSLPSFKAAGGIVLILLGVQMSLGLSLPKEKEEVSEIAVVLATPLITGPATITTAIILSNDVGIPITAMAGSVAFLITLGALLFATKLVKFVGKAGIQIMSTMIGIVTLAWGLQFVLSGVSSVWSGAT